MVLILEADKSGNISWWADAAFAVHHKMRSHTGGVITIDKGTIYAISIKKTTY